MRYATMRGAPTASSGGGPSRCPLDKRQVPLIGSKGPLSTCRKNKINKGDRINKINKGDRRNKINKIKAAKETKEIE